MTLTQLFSLAEEELRATAFKNRCGGLDGLLFLGLFMTVVQELSQANKGGKQTLTLFLRERDYSYFGAQRWLSNPPASLKDSRISLETSPGCVEFEGEIPILYLVKAHINGGGPAPTSISSSFLSLVDFVTKTTGSGLGIMFAGDFGVSPLGFGATDLRTGRRIRYAVRKFDGSHGVSIQSAFWVERIASGRGPGIPG
jgi:hypothetical protein